MDVSGVFVPLPFFLSLLNCVLLYFVSIAVIRGTEPVSHPCFTAILSRGLFLAAHPLKTRARSQVLLPVMPPLTGQGSQQGSGTLPSPRTPVQSWTPSSDP